MSPTSIDTRVGPVPVRVVGDSGPAVLAVHGLLLDSRLWDGVAHHLSGRVRLVLPDLPLGAHKRAVPDRARLTSADLAGALFDILDGLELPSAVLLGNDTGGALAQIAAARTPERVEGLVLAGCDAFEHFPPPLIRPFVALAPVPGAVRVALRAFALPRVLARPSRLNLFSVRGLGDALTRDLLSPARTDPEVRADLAAFVRQVRPEPLLAATEGLSALSGRAQVVWGRLDRVFPLADAERLAELLGTRVTWVPDAGTFLPVDRPDAVAAAVERVLTGSDGRTAVS